MKIHLAPALAALVLASSPLSASAGDDWHPTVFVNMTPDAKTSKASKACVNAMRKPLIAEDGPVKKFGETKTRALVGMPKSGVPISRWPASIFDRKLWDEKGPFAGSEDPMRQVVLIDCRPEDGYFDSLIISYPFDESETRGARESTSLRGVSWTQKLQSAVARAYYYH